MINIQFKQHIFFAVLSILFFISIFLLLFFIFWMDTIFYIVYSIILINLSFLSFYLAKQIKTYGSIQSYFKLLKKYIFLRRNITIKKRKCIFCRYTIRFSYFFWINFKHNPKDILEIWNSSDNSFYCSNCYFDLNIEDELNTSYLGFYKIKKYTD